MQNVSRFALFLAVMLGAVPLRPAGRPAHASSELTIKSIFARAGAPDSSNESLQDFAWRPDGKVLGRLIRSGDHNKPQISLQLFTTESRQSNATVIITLPSSTRHFEWSFDGSALLLSSPRSLTWFDLKTKHAKLLLSETDEISDPKISPDAHWVTFIKNHNLWLIDVARGQARRLTTDGTRRLRMGEPDRLYREQFNLPTAYWWAPDSSTLAFLEIDETQVPEWPAEYRPKHAQQLAEEAYPLPGSPVPNVQVAVLRPSDRTVRRIDSGQTATGYIPRVTWLPDSRQLALQLLDRKQSKLTLVFANAKTGKSRTILTETDAYWINLHDDLRFLKSAQAAGCGTKQKRNSADVAASGESVVREFHRSCAQFIWSSERSGYRHLYLYNSDGQLAAQLTRGDWEVTQVNAIDESKALVYFTSTAKSPLERHLSRVALDGSGLEQITAQTGSHQALFNADAQAFVDSYSSVTTSPVQKLMRADGSALLPDLESKNVPVEPPLLSQPEFLSVKTHDGVLLNALQIKPANFDASRKYPALVYIYGGPGEQVVRNAWGGKIFLWHELMAQQGFLIFALDTRGTAGRGHLFEEPIHCRLGAQEISDLRDGVSYLQQLPYVDRARIGVWGSGYGGHIVLHAMFEGLQEFKAGFADAPIADWQLYSAAFSERYLEVPKGFSGQFEESSPIKDAAHLHGKLLISASPDDDVQAANIAALQSEFLKTGKHPEVMLSSDPSAIFRRAADFFRETLNAP